MLTTLFPAFPQPGRPCRHTLAVAAPERIPPGRKPRRADPQPNTRDVFAPPAYGLFDLHAEPGIDDIPETRSAHIAARREVRMRESSRPVLKEELAAIRRLFDWLIALWVVLASSAGDHGSECRRSE